MKTPWHIWVVGIVTLLWNAGGAYDYLMAELRNPTYLAMIPEEDRAGYVAYLDAMPIWAVSAWAIGVWGSILGSILILLRSRHAVTALAISLAGLVVTTIYTFFLAPPSPFTTISPATLAFTAAILVVLLGSLYYVRRQTAAGQLR